MNKGRLLYTGKAKDLYETENPDLLWIVFKNDATAFNGEKKATFEKKGLLNLAISSRIFKYLEQKGIKTHLVETISDIEQIIQKVDIIPLEVVVRNVYAGSLSKRLGKPEGEVLPRPIVEFYYKDDALNDPLITSEHIDILGLATPEELEDIKEKALKINTYLCEIFKLCNITLVDYKIEMGRLASGEIILADEISPDSCRLWDSETQQKLDKDVFRRGIGDLITVYEEVLERLEQAIG